MKWYSNLITVNQPLHSSMHVEIVQKPFNQMGKTQMH